MCIFIATYTIWPLSALWSFGVHLPCAWSAVSFISYMCKPCLLIWKVGSSPLPSIGEQKEVWLHFHKLSIQKFPNWCSPSSWALLMPILILTTPLLMIPTPSFCSTGISLLQILYPYSKDGNTLPVTRKEVEQTEVPEVLVELADIIVSPILCVVQRNETSELVPKSKSSALWHTV